MVLTAIRPALIINAKDINACNRMKTSKRLAVLYGLAALSGGCATATLLALWLHWRNTLNHCAKVDCGCILYAVSTFSDVVGGASPYCQFTAFAPLPAAFIATVLAVVHFYWGHIRVKRKQRLRLQYNLVDTKRPQSVIECRRLQSDEMSESKRRSVIGRLAVQTALAGIVTVVQIGQVAVLTHGFSVTCREYRKTIMSILDASGSLANMINSRMMCTTVFDFMDYTKPDFHKIYGPDIWTPSGRPVWDPGLINTGAAFVFALIFSYAQLLFWVAVGVYSAFEARKFISGQTTPRRNPTQNGNDRRPLNTAL